MQAITTKYVGPGNAHGSKIKARAWAGTLAVKYDDSLDRDANHAAAARALAEKMNWLDGGRYTIATGCAPDGSGDNYVHVLVPAERCQVCGGPYNDAGCVNRLIVSCRTTGREVPA